MISHELAAELRSAGLTWRPAQGDWFVIPGQGPDDREHVLGDLGTPEWDTLAPSEALWLPREDQLRDILGEAFIGLEHIPGETPGYAVSTLVGDTEQRFVDVDVAAAYGRAALALLASTL